MESIVSIVVIEGERVKPFVFISLLATVFVTYAAEMDLNRDVINKRLITLIADNNIVGQADVDGIDRDGKNLAQIKEWIATHTKDIDFGYTASGIVTNGMGGPHTALQLACLIQACSHQVVKLLCANGATHIKNEGRSFPVTHCLNNIFYLYDQYGHEDPSHVLYDHQIKKLKHLKFHASGAHLEVDKEDAKTLKRLDLMKAIYENNQDSKTYSELVSGTTL
jgi:hypothetical protein